MTFSGKRIAVIGAARTGVAVARALTPLGASVCVLDASAEADYLRSAESLRLAGAEAVWGRDDGPEVTAADIVVPSPGVPKYSNVLMGAVQRGQTIWSEPEVAWRISKAPIYGITGTNGKTTTTALLGRMLSDAGLDARVGGNIAPGRPLVDLASEAPAGAVLVAELSSFQMEWIQDFRPVIGIITNISQDHLNRHKTMTEYCAMKARLFENQTADCHTVVNADNALAGDAARSSEGQMWTWSRRSEVPRGAFMRDGVLMLRDASSEVAVLPAADIRLFGQHNLENAMAASIAAWISGVQPSSIADTLRQFTAVEHRMEVVATIDDVLYINNSMCTNPVALSSSIEACPRPVVLIAGGAGKNLDFGAVPAIISEHCTAVITIGAFGPMLAEMARTAGVGFVENAGTLEAAVSTAARVARPGEAVMLAPGCASFDQFVDFEDRGNQFKAAVAGLV